MPHDARQTASRRDPPGLHDAPELRERIAVFEDRRHAGAVLADLMTEYRQAEAIVLAVPAGGVPVALALAARLDLPMDLAVVSKVTLPWNTEAGCGAVAFDGSVKLNDPVLRAVGLGGEPLQQQLDATREKVRRREQNLRGGRGPLPVSDAEVVLVDDGLASGFTMHLAVEAVRNAGARRVTVAVPTAPATTLEDLLPKVDDLYCANIRSASPFAVAAAYRNWRDLSESEVAGMLDA